MERTEVYTTSTNRHKNHLIFDYTTFKIATIFLKNEQTDAWEIEKVMEVKC